MHHVPSGDLQPIAISSVDDATQSRCVETPVMTARVVRSPHVVVADLRPKHVCSLEHCVSRVYEEEFLGL